MRRFVVEAVAFSVLATALWWLSFTTDAARQATIELARILHRVAGLPAPYLLAEVKPYYWHAPLFSPLVGLLLASRWLPWPERLTRLAIALACFWFLAALQIVIVYSPYLPLSLFRGFIERIYISSGYLVSQVILWLVLTGGPFRLMAGASKAGASSVGSAAHPLFSRSWHAAAAAGGLCLFFVLPIFICAHLGAPGWAEARRAMARGLAQADDGAALVGLQRILPTDPNNDGLIYLAARLHQKRGEMDDARILARVVFQRRHLMEYFAKEFGAPPALGAGSANDRRLSPARM